jgi:hypothetical protein
VLIGHIAQAKGDHLDPVHSDQMVLVMVRQEAGPYEGRPNSKATFSQAKTKGIYQARVHSDQMVLVIVGWEAGPMAW